MSKGWIELSIRTFPEFLLVVVVSFFLLVLFAGVFLSLFRKKITLLDLTLSSYAGISLFILLNYFSWYLIDWQVAMVAILALMGTLSAYGWFRAFDKIKIERNLLAVGVGGLTLALGFFLFKMTYNNGLHDEYFHYSAVQIFDHFHQYPFTNPYNFTIPLNQTYHVGTYFLVILFENLKVFNLEQALDATKILLLLPLPTLITFSLRKLFDKTPDWLVFFSTTAIFLVGPSWWLKDAFSLWLTSHSDVPQIYMPILYDLAGVTWAGVSFWLVLVLALLLGVTQKAFRSFPYLVFMGLILVATSVVNKAYFMTSLMAFGAVGIYVLGARIWPKYEKHFLNIAILASFLGFLLLATNILPVPTLLQKYLRNPELRGYPYATYVYSDGIQVEHSYMLFGNSNFLSTFGLAPLLILLVVGLIVFKSTKMSKANKYFSLIFITFALILPEIVYFMSDAELGLALNKLLRPAVVLVALIPLFTYNLKYHKIALVLVVVLAIGMISPARFFVVNAGEGLQRFWIDDSNERKGVVEFLEQNQYRRVLTHNWNDGYYLSNLLPIQVETCLECEGRMGEVLVTAVGGMDRNQDEQIIYEDQYYAVQEIK